MAGEGFSYNLHVTRSQADRLTRQFYELGISRSAVLRAAIDSIPLRLVLGTPRPLVRARAAATDLVRVGFAITAEQREKLDQIQAAGYESADILRAALEPFLDLSIAELEKRSDLHRAPKRHKAIREARLAAKALRGGEDPPTGEGAYERLQIVKDAAKRAIRPEINGPVSVPVRTPAIDWSKAGPVEPRSKPPSPSRKKKG